MNTVLSRRALNALMLASVWPGGLSGRLFAQDAGAADVSLFVPTDGISGSYESVVRLARERAQDDADMNFGALSGIFSDLSYDAYRAIRPKPMPLGTENVNLVFDALPPGSLFSNPVRLSVIREGATYDLRFDTDIFSFGEDHFDPEAVARFRESDPPDDLGYSGFRLRGPLNRPDKLDEFVVFQGASYFRAVARDMIYGLSARGLAIGTATPEGEEFARFLHFWIETPEPNATNVRVRALLESDSCAGAFEFDISPGETTVMQTRCTLFPRRKIDHIGIAPLTSMFYFGPSGRSRVDDFRDAVHDSSGLQMITGAGRRIWRSLANPPTLQVSAFADENPKGFGLTQRHRDFDYFQDAEARYDRRPSCWIEPLGNWGRGTVVLVEIPVKAEFHDNIVAFWRPEAPVRPAETGHEFSYRIHWCPRPPDYAPFGRVYALRSGAAVNAPEKRVFVVDFVKEEPWAEDLSVHARAAGAPIAGVALHPLPDGKSMRASFTIPVSDAPVTEFEMTLMGPNGPESETWLYRLTRS